MEWSYQQKSLTRIKPNFTARFSCLLRTCNSSLPETRKGLIQPLMNLISGLLNTVEPSVMITVRAQFGQSNFSFFQQKRKKEILLILTMFAYFKVPKKREKRKKVRKIDHFFIFSNFEVKFKNTKNTVNG